LIFIEEKLRNEIEFDAILLIDTEGLGAPEKQNDVDTEKKDRLLATFAMGVSHLTLVNVLGEYMRDLTEILQISIVAMARLEKAEIKPDILMVQHLTERNIEKISSASKNFSDALEKAILITDEKDVNLGVRNSESLKTLRNTLAMGKLFRQFRPFKNGASVNSPPSEEYHQDVVELYKYIIGIAKNRSTATDFKQWQNLVQSFWDAIRNENFMKFKDIKDLQEFFEVNDYVSKVKESIECSFREHSEELKKFVSEQAKKFNKKEITKDEILKTLEKKVKYIPSNCHLGDSCSKCAQVAKNKSDLFALVEKKSSNSETRSTIHDYLNKTREWHFKLLSQMLNAVAFKQVESAGVFEKIELKLKNYVKDEKMDIDVEVQTIFEEICLEAKNNVTQIPVEENIYREITEAYRDIADFNSKYKNEKVPSLRERPAIDKTSFGGYLNPFSSNKFLETNQVYDLEGKIDEMINDLLNEYNSEIYQRGMVARMKKHIDSILNDFERVNDLKFKIEFKWAVYLYSNQRFKLKMNNLQKKWDDQNNPFELIHKNKKMYVSVIYERLKYGFSYQSDGSIAGNCLLNAIGQKAQTKIDKQLTENVLQTNWLANSQTVRLKYFTELATTINTGDKSKALKHFENPKNGIEEWYLEFLSSFKEGDKIKFDRIFMAELSKIRGEICELKSIVEMRKFIENYISPFDGIDFPPGLDSTKALPSDIDNFRNRILEVLDDNEKCTKIYYQIKFVRLNEDKMVMDRLGCTNVCKFCHALCWGQRAHEEDQGGTKQHFTCHQPMGLSGKCQSISKELIAEACHEWKDNSKWEEKGKSMTWKELKNLPKYKDWRFDEHIDAKLIEMMSWFFWSLNEDIAEKYELKPAKRPKSYSELIFDSILIAVNGIFLGYDLLKKGMGYSTDEENQHQQ
jgi:hypothetical protein